VRFEEAFGVDRPPEVVFDYMTDPANLAQWQTTKTFVEPLSPGPPGLGSRFREGTKPPGGREFTMVTEFTEFDRPRRFHVHVVEGPHPIDGTWSFEPDGTGTRVRFVAEGELGGVLRWLEPVAKRVMARQFAKYHRLLRINLER
jgi:carbon monoxide dehydrogenase subunit G